MNDRVNAMHDLDRMRAAADKIGPKAGGSGVMADINAAIARHRDNDTSGEYQTVQRVPRPEVHVSDEDAWRRIKAANPMHKPTVQGFEGPVGAVIAMPSDPAWKADLDATIARHRADFERDIGSPLTPEEAVAVDAVSRAKLRGESYVTERKLRQLAETKAEALYWRKRAEAAEAYIAGLLQS